MTRFVRYVVSSMAFAKIQTIPSVVGIVTSANPNGIRNASVPKVKTRMSERDRDRDQLAPEEVLGEDGVEVALDRRLARDVDLGARDRAARLAACRPCGPWSPRARGSRRSGATTSSSAARPPTTRPVGARQPPARRPRARSGTSTLARSRRSRPTIVNVPVERWPNRSSRISSARRVSVPGSVKRFVRSSESCVEASPHDGEHRRASAARTSQAVTEDDARQPFHRAPLLATSRSSRPRAGAARLPRRALGRLPPPHARDRADRGDPDVRDEGENPRN